MLITGWVTLGLIVGLVAGKAFGRSRQGIVLDVVLGTVGALAGGLLSHLLVGTTGTGLDLYSYFIATVTAVAAPWVFHTITDRWAGGVDPGSP